MPSISHPDFSGAAQPPNDDQPPEWKLDNYYPEGYDGEEYKNDFIKLEAWTKDLAKRYEGKINTLSGDQLADLLNEWTDKDDLRDKLAVFVDLLSWKDKEAHDPAKTRFLNRAGPINAQDAYIEDEIKRIPEERMQSMLAESEKLRVYQPRLRKIREKIPHTAPIDIERYRKTIDTEGQIVGLYDKILDNQRFTFQGKTLDMTEIISIFYGDPDPNIRRAAHELFIEVFSRDQVALAGLLNIRIGLWNKNNIFENYNNPWDPKYKENGVDPDIIDAMENSVRGAYASTMQRFYSLKARLMGKQRLDIWDRQYNPLGNDDDAISFSEAREIILNAVHSFSPKLAEITQEAYDNGWIDAAKKPHKIASAHSDDRAARTTNPWQLLTFDGSFNALTTLAHENGHAVHQRLAAHKGDRILRSPMTTAEISSIFFETLVFKYMMANSGSPEERRRILLGKIEEDLNNISRQVSFHVFEKRAYSEQKETNTALSKERFSELFLEALRESYGDAIELDESYGVMYNYVSHFMWEPFYVHAYAFSGLLVYALYAVYEKSIIPDFEDKFIEALEMGGTLTLDDFIVI